MKQATIRTTIQKLFFAYAIFIFFGATSHVALLLLKALLSQDLRPLGVISIMDLEYFFPFLAPNLSESLVSVGVYGLIIGLIFMVLRKQEITISMKKRA